MSFLSVQKSFLMERQTEGSEISGFFPFCLLDMSLFKGEMYVPDPASVMVNGLFPFLFMGDLASHWMQGQNPLWCMRNLSKVDEVAFVNVIWLRVCNWRKGAFLSIDL